MRLIENYNEISLDTISEQSKSCIKFRKGICHEECPYAKDCVLYDFLPSAVLIFLRYAKEIERIKEGKEPDPIDYKLDSIRLLDEFYKNKSLDEISEMAMLCNTNDNCSSTCPLRKKDTCIGAYVARTPLNIFVRYAKEIEKLKMKR